MQEFAGTTRTGALTWGRTRVGSLTHSALNTVAKDIAGKAEVTRRPWAADDSTVVNECTEDIIG